ncbi:hypothetical protein A3A69_02265 [candidate division WWE3 bacterium RIFCSPLOWO2_01_FULL_37_15]|uniref:VOC domain-containing protein n=1 Tax=candidate division WWE3 bacterium RIFCSPLOWO2_01_FULL_37_15 TaxID=1802622 RepID=A0A1F4UWM9_UNCKA|nr:MAG: hypothetical protein A3A69_02265 [candidate division WWE3 bacterium RIFCSPLOWO2_01_FULL_37_15]
MINGAGVHIKVNNFEKSLKFYTSLGFIKVFEYGPGKSVEEKYHGAVFEHGEFKLEIADGHRAVKPEVFNEQVKSSKISLMLYVGSLEEIIKKCEKNKINIVVPPRHYYWGTLELVIKDPDGVVLVFIAPYNKLSADKIKADESWANKRD